MTVLNITLIITPEQLHFMIRE
ncbi:hypothetical protein B4U80_07615 [Leptotrombidium deliense]|uniref:Uncharacterized protein n=1 Tax=Leptotrombidium deliense TaxID=299467 RepID=A0A443RWG3_9ACAR|nr:hypothetical protein B4U80_07615 [Leptotrombidium deliense]